MTPTSLKNQSTIPMDDATKALIEEALQSAERGEIFTEEEVEAELDEANQEWQESQYVARPA